MDEEKVCSYCEEPIEEEDYKVLGDDSIVCNSCFEEECKQCSICKKYYLADNMFTLDDKKESLVCEDCYENEREECAMCGGHFLSDEMTFWGDARICSACLDEQCPAFDEKEVEAMTQDAYNEFCQKYIGKHVVDQEPGEIALDITVGDEAPICYSISVTLDKSGIITKISRLTASMLLSEGCRSSDWRPYRIDSSDYDFWAADLLEDNLEFEEDDDELEE